MATTPTSGPPPTTTSPSRPAAKPKKQTAAEIIAAGPPPSGGTLHPIGVPDGFIAPHAEQKWSGVPFARDNTKTVTTDVPARYHEGDEYLPANLQPAQIRELQRRMIAGGLIPKGAEYRDGYWDDVSRTAYRELLAEANGSGFTADLQLSQRESSSLEELRKYVTPGYLKPDPAVQRETVRKLMQTALGTDRKPTDEELNHLTAVLGQFDHEGFNAKVAADKAQFDAAQAGNAAGSVSQTVDDPTARLDAYLRDRYKPEIQRHEGVVDMAANRENLMGNVFALDKQIVGAGA